MTLTHAHRSVLCLAFALCLACACGCGFGFGSKVENGSIEVYYKDGATKAEAEKLAAYLVKQWGAAGERRSVQITKSGGKYQFRMVVKKDFEKNPAVLAEVPIIAARLSRDVFDGADVEFHVCDERLNTLKSMSMRDDMRTGILRDKIEVFYTPPVSKAEAEDLAKHMKAEMGANDKDLSLVVMRRGDVVEVRMPFEMTLLNDPGTEASLRQDIRRLSNNVFKGAAVELHLCDLYLNVQKTIKP